MAGTCRKDEGLLSNKHLLVCKPVCRKRSAGGQKRRWNDVLVGELKRCDLMDDWRKTAQDRVPEMSGDG